jgi:hypothetical protein
MAKTRWSKAQHQAYANDLLQDVKTNQEKENLADSLDRLSNEISAVRDALDDAATSIEWAFKKLAEEFENFTWHERGR